MKTYAIIAAFVLCGCLLSACKKETEVKGDVFVVTQGAGNYKLGLVQVAAIQRKLYEPYISKRKNAFDASKQKYVEINDRCNALVKNLEGLSLDQLDSRQRRLGDCEKELSVAQEDLGNTFFVEMPVADATATTDADGKFTMKIPKAGEYIFTARAERKVVDKTEKYYWAVSIKATGEQQQIMLSNNNQLNLVAPETIFSNP